MILAMTGCKPEVKLTPTEAKEIAREAYVYGLPMVVNYKTMYLYTLNENSPEYKGPFYVVMRLYGPEETALNGEWVNPPMIKTN